ncbi:MAG TPA: hypothetical protein VG826_34275 [Pirellulales bacterium]|nr:hypothetical protein [Pirellulales bacterium]
MPFDSLLPWYHPGMEENPYKAPVAFDGASPKSTRNKWLLCSFGVIFLWLVTAMWMELSRNGLIEDGVHNSTVTKIQVRLAATAAVALIGLTLFHWRHRIRPA